jgi:membrane protein
VRLSDVYRRFVFGGAGVAAGTDAASGLGAGPGAGAVSGEPAPASPLSLDTATLARQVEAAVERGLDQTLAEHFAN